jgi:hypothetical protein
LEPGAACGVALDFSKLFLEWLIGYSRFFVAKTSKCGVYIEGKSGAFGMKMGACLGAALGD